MTELEFNTLKSEAGNYKYHSFEHLEYEAVTEYQVIEKNEEILLLYGKEEKSGYFEAHWAANEPEKLIQSVLKLKQKVLVNFIPKEWREIVKGSGFTDYAMFREYWLEDIEKAAGKKDMLLLTEEECSQAAQVTQECGNQSRGFLGESEEWIGEWIHGNDPNVKDIGGKDCNILVHKEDGNVVGVACVTIYGRDSKKGAILWFREIAVKPQFQGRGIGRKLIHMGIQYGKDRGAKRAFLMADDCNATAIRLYKSAGFVPNDEVEINMVSGV